MRDMITTLWSTQAQYWLATCRKHEAIYLVFAARVTAMWYTHYYCFTFI